MSEPENKLPETPDYAAPQTIEQPPVEEPARLGPLGRLTGTLMSPGETFADVNRKPITTAKQFREALKGADLKKGVILNLTSRGTSKFEILKDGGE